MPPIGRIPLDWRVLLRLHLEVEFAILAVRMAMMNLLLVCLLSYQVGFCQVDQAVLVLLQVLVLKPVVMMMQVLLQGPLLLPMLLMLIGFWGPLLLPMLLMFVGSWGLDAQQWSFYRSVLMLATMSPVASMAMSSVVSRAMSTAVSVAVSTMAVAVALSVSTMGLLAGLAALLVEPSVPL